MAHSSHAGLNTFIEFAASLCRPERIQVCDGSEEERQTLLAEMCADKTLQPIAWPDCFLHRSDPADVARVEERTFICSESQGDAGPTNRWMAPADAKALLKGLFEGAMEGRTLYVVPYLMGPGGSPFAKVGVELTDSPYVVLSMRTMTRMGAVALEQLGTDGSFVPGVHARGTLDPAQRYICHFPETREIWSFSSNYGGNALLGKKCFALRIASALARDEGWLAEHMMILELTDPQGGRHYFAGAFPSACGKTNLAMLVSKVPGWSVRTVGDDIAWLRVGDDGRLWAVNPEAGFFGVAPGTSARTNPNALATIASHTIFTNVAVSDDGQPWWEGMGEPPAEWLTDWKGRRRRVAESAEPLAHPNSRFTVPASNCPSISPHWEDPMGVPLSGILFGGRRDDTLPLVFEAFDWEHGVFLGATMASQTTAAAQGAVGVLRRDPMAMLPFCGYHMADYFAHWLTFARCLARPPKIFHVNWFQRGDDGKIVWPGFGENVRALIWMVERIEGRGSARKSPIGWIPAPEDLHRDGLELDDAALAWLLSVDPVRWSAEADAIAAHFATFGDRLPGTLHAQLAALRERLAAP